jgi:hypothetical protein
MSMTRTLMIAASATAVGLGGVALAPAATAATSQTVVIDCQGKGVVKPKEIVMACADGSIEVMSIRWTSWTANSARGTGTLVWNTCLPTDCAAGIVQKYKVRVVLGRVASGPNIDVFSGMTLRFPDLGPAAAETSTYTLDNRLASNQ